jgi:hypothetical protein
MDVRENVSMSDFHAFGRPSEPLVKRTTAVWSGPEGWAKEEVDSRVVRHERGTQECEQLLLPLMEARRFSR